MMQIWWRNLSDNETISVCCITNFFYIILQYRLTQSSPAGMKAKAPMRKPMVTMLQKKIAFLYYYTEIIYMKITQSQEESKLSFQIARLRSRGSWCIVVANSEVGISAELTLPSTKYNGTRIIFHQLPSHNCWKPIS